MAGEETPVVHYEMSNDVTIGTIDASASLDADGAKHFGDEVIKYIKAHPGIRLLLNFQYITYISSAALTELLRINDAARNAKGSVKLCGVSKDLHKVFAVTRLAEVFKVNPDEDVERTIMRLNQDADWDAYPT